MAFELSERIYEAVKKEIGDGGDLAKDCVVAAISRELFVVKGSYRSSLGELATQARLLAEDVIAANPGLEFDAWCDNVTDNLLLKSWHHKEKFALACAVTRTVVETSGDLAGDIKRSWEGLASAMNTRPITNNRIGDRDAIGSAGIVRLS